MFNRLILSLVRKAIFAAIILGVLLVVGYFASDRKDYPGKAEFQNPDSLIDSKSRGTAHGNTDAAQQAAARFAATLKPLQAASFTGGSGRSFASGGEFLTYCRHNPGSVAFIVHVPELRNYKKAESREALATLAWAAANQAAEGLSFTTDTPEIIVGLRGFASYGPIWSGKRGGKPESKSDGPNEVRRLYPFFVASSNP